MFVDHGYGDLFPKEFHDRSVGLTSEIRNMDVERYSRVILTTIMVVPTSDKTQEKNMKTGRDANRSDLYISECCLKEVRFLEGQMFSRCPRCNKGLGFRNVEAQVAHRSY